MCRPKARQMGRGAYGGPFPPCDRHDHLLGARSKNSGGKAAHARRMLLFMSKGGSLAILMQFCGCGVGGGEESGCVMMSLRNGG